MKTCDTIQLVRLALVLEEVDFLVGCSAVREKQALLQHMRLEVQCFHRFLG